MPFLTHDQLMQRIGWWALDQDSPPAKNTSETEVKCPECEFKWLLCNWTSEEIVNAKCPKCHTTFEINCVKL